MCTVTWLYANPDSGDTGYELFFNRDELNTRLPASPPQHLYRDNVAFLSALDGNAGGSWLSVNQWGTTVALLNNYAYQRSTSERAWISRGQLLLSLATVTDPVTTLHAMDLSHYQAFHLLVLTPQGDTCLATWDGEHLSQTHNPVQPISSSSWQTESVIAGRKQYFQEMTCNQTVTPALLEQFHRSHHCGVSPYSVCMHREDAATISFSHIKVGQQQVSFNYYDGSPCQKPLLSQASIMRTAPTAVHVA